jgi:hypothetical protein
VEASLTPCRISGRVHLTSESSERLYELKYRREECSRLLPYIYRLHKARVTLYDVNGQVWQMGKVEFEF